MIRRISAIAVALGLVLTLSFGLQDLTAAPAAAGELTFEIYKDAKKEYRWRLKSPNGKIIAMSDEGYTRKDACQHAIDVIKDGAAKAKVEDNATKD